MNEAKLSLTEQNELLLRENEALRRQLVEAQNANMAKEAFLCLILSLNPSESTF